MPTVRSPPLRQCYDPHLCDNVMSLSLRQCQELTLTTMFPFTSYTINKGINVKLIQVSQVFTRS